MATTRTRKPLTEAARAAKAARGAASYAARTVTAEQRTRQHAADRKYKAAPEHQAQRRAYNRARNATPEHQAYERARRATPEYQAYERARRATPEYQAQHRESEYRRLYGITTAQYERMFTALGSKCPLCKTPSRSSRRLAVHHDHILDDRVARGEITKADTVVTILCGRHNRYLTLYGDSAAGLRDAADKLDAAAAITRAALRATVSPGEVDMLRDETDDDA